MSSTKELLVDLSPAIKVYTDGTVDRLFFYPYAPPSSGADPTTAVSSKDVTISSYLSARLYLPHLTPGDANSKIPILVYYHGGGFTLGSAFSCLDHSYLNVLSAAAAALIVTVEYRLAPEHPLPTAYEDSWEGLSWVCSKKDQWLAEHGDFTRLFVGGDSAGGNIAHNLSLRAGSDPLPGKIRIRGAILSHPFFLGSIPVENEPKENRHLSAYERMWHLAYPSAGRGIDEPLINPLVDGAPSLSGLGCSKIQICVSSKDVLAARGLAYAAEVSKCGWEGEVEVVKVEGEEHCFHVFNHETEKAKYLINKMAAFIAQ